MLEKERQNQSDLTSASSSPSAVQEKGLMSKTPNGIKEVPTVRLLPEQIEEIHADEYSLKLFYATRIEPQTLAQIKRDFPEPEAKKAQSILDRFVRVGLVHVTVDGKYYSNYTENYINYASYR